MTLSELNLLTDDAAREALSRCCGASRWVAGMLASRPFADEKLLHTTADHIWATMTRADILEAFSHHPQIGADLENLRRKFATTATWSADEQASVASADELTLQALARANQEYVHRFGYIFIICASGKTAPEMLELLTDRLKNDGDTELPIAAAEQAKITHIRLNKLLEVESTP